LPPPTDTDVDARLGLLSNPEFVDWALSQGKTPNEALGFPDVLSRSLACVRPIILDRISESGEMAELRIPCGTANALKCPSCSEFSQRLRQRQILNGFDSADTSTRVALFTNTAPSFGRVHRASITAKADFKTRHLYGAAKERALQIVANQKGPCVCGKFHRYDDAAVGTPLNRDTYNYAKEVVWSENLPALVKSLTRSLRYLARKLGIEDEQMGLFTVFERQKRGSLHTHTLVVVRGRPQAFDMLAKEIRTGWGPKKEGRGGIHVPTAKIPDYRVTWLHSDLTKKRWAQFAGSLLPEDFDAKKAIPRAKWKGGELVPATQFGETWDWRELTGSTNLDGEKDGQNGFKQAGAYLSKYLTKNQQATAWDAISELPHQQAVHFRSMRLAAGILTIDRIMVETVLRTLERSLKEIEQEIAALQLSDFVEDEEEERLRGLAAGIHSEILATLKDLEKPTENNLFMRLFSGSFEFLSITQADVAKHAVSWGENRAARGLAIRINKVLDNAGFSGSLVGISHWGTTLKDLKDEMREYMAKADGGEETPEEFLYLLNPVRMKEIRELRAKKPKIPEPVDILDRLAGSRLVRTEKPPQGETPLEKWNRRLN
jgi:hypothetical protein